MTCRPAGRPGSPTSRWASSRSWSSRTAAAWRGGRTTPATSTARGWSPTPTATAPARCSTTCRSAGRRDCRCGPARSRSALADATTYRVLVRTAADVAPRTLARVGAAGRDRPRVGERPVRRSVRRRPAAVRAAHRAGRHPAPRPARARRGDRRRSSPTWSTTGSPSPWATGHRCGATSGWPLVHERDGVERPAVWSAATGRRDFPLDLPGPVDVAGWWPDGRRAAPPAHAPRPADPAPAGRGDRGRTSSCTTPRAG